MPTVTFCRRLRGLQSQKAAWHSGLPRATGLCVTTVCGSAAPRDDRGGSLSAAHPHQPQSQSRPTVTPRSVTGGILSRSLTPEHHILMQK